MDSPLDDIEFLVRSEHRVEVLDALAEHPRSRTDLRALTRASSSTIGRMLREFEDRRWIVRDGHQYEATQLGGFVASGVMDLLERMETEQELREVMRWFPTDEVTFDVVRCLRDAEIVRWSPTNPDPTLHVRRVAEWLGAAEQVRVVVNVVTPSVMGAIRQGIVNGEQTFEAVLTPDVFASVENDPEMAAALSELVESENYTAFAYDDDLPVRFFIADDTIGIGLSSDEGFLRELVISDDEDVREWAVGAFETYRDEAKLVYGP